MKASKELEKALKILWQWRRTNVGNYTEVLESKNGKLKVEVSYTTEVRNGTYQWYWDEATPKLTKEQKNAFDALGLDDGDIVEYLDISEILKIYLQDLRTEQEDFVQEVWDSDEDNILDHTYFDMDEIHEYATFEDLWEQVVEHEELTTDVKLNDRYNATITQGSNDVTVGCQTINIERIRQVVEAWDEVNG